MARGLENLVGHQTVANVESGVKGLEARFAVIGADSVGLGLQVLVCDWAGTGSPSVEAMRGAHNKRLGKKIFPLVVATVDVNAQVWLLGPAIDGSPVGPIGVSQAERILQAALNEPTGLSGRRRLAHLLDSIRSTDIAGMTNAGLFATHYVSEGIRTEPNWAEATDAARPWLKLRGESLIGSMGYTVKTSTANAHVLTTTGHNQPRAVAVLLKESESFDADSPRFAVSPVMFGLKVAKREGAPWLIVLRGSQVRLYSARPGVGVGARGQAETYFELDLALLDEDDAAYLAYGFSANGLCDGGLVQRLIEGSERFATGLGERLRQRVYDHVVPRLAVAVANELDRLGHGDDLALSYRTTLRILFRLVFQAYAEDRGLLPYGRNDRYTRNSLKRWALDMVEQPDLDFDPESSSMWADLLQVWGVIDTGDTAWDVPAYNGGLFGIDAELHPAGALIRQLELENSVIGPALRHLLVDDTVDDSIGPVDFRSLSVREFGTIYEGLLESSLSRADQNLTIDKDKAYVPAAKDDTVLVNAGEIYFHNSSGERKATGSYFTPHFAVEHLLERSLEPALEQHLSRVAKLLEVGDQAGATESFFDFRVADLAMGSGHFLVSAIDHIESGMAAFLVDNDLPGIADELRRLEDAARSNLGDAATDYEIEPSALLRRQIARRCVYGLDINDVAVELARVSIWIHTFIPGLPMSSLDHNLVQANSLTGIGTIDEAIDALDPPRQKEVVGQISALYGPIRDALEKAKTLLVGAANASEATKAEVRRAAETFRGAAAAALPTKLLFDAAVAVRIGILDTADLIALTPGQIQDMACAPSIADRIRDLQPAHMPYLFPEVFLKENPGFDCLIGNPPWEKVKVEEHAWWGQRFSGLRGVPQKQKNALLSQLKTDRPDLVAEYEAEVLRTNSMRSTIAHGPYPGIGRGDIDLFQAFVWRNWHLLRSDGYAGTVLPRGALSGSGTVEWRRTVLSKGGYEDVCFLTNRSAWVFEGVDGRYTLALVTTRKGGARVISFCGPFYSFDEYEAGHTDRSIATADDFASWSNSLSFPTVPDAFAGEILQHMKRQPSFADEQEFAFRPHRELDTSRDKSWFDFDLDNPTGTVPVWTGRTINIWHPNFGSPYAYADDALLDHLAEKAIRASKSARSALHGLTITTRADSPPSSARIAFRDVARATDTRTAIFCLIPPDVAVVEKSPYLVRQLGQIDDEAFLLGVVSSIPFDWYARRWIETKVSFELLNPMPIPRPQRSSVYRLRIVELAGRLAAVDDRYEVWADAVGVPIGTLLMEQERSEALAELDALVALLYGLAEDQLRHIFATFHRGWDYAGRWSAVQQHYQTWEARK